MFDCKKCDANREEIQFLRGLVKSQQDQILALSNSQAFAALQFSDQKYDPKEFYGGDDDERIEYDRIYGHKILVKGNQSAT